MLKIISFVVFVVILEKYSGNCFPDLIPEAITVYRNPEFFKKLNYDPYVNNRHQKSRRPPQGAHVNYKYPGETKKPHQPTPFSSFEVNYDNSPEFRHEPRDVIVGTTSKPSRRKGPYSPLQSSENNVDETFNDDVKQQEDDEGTDDEQEIKENENSDEKNYSEEGTKEISSLLSSNPDEEYKSYHEPIILTPDGYETDESSEFASSTYNKPFAYNKTNPLLYEDWKHYTYPSMNSKKRQKSYFSRLYSEEPSSNAFESHETPSYYKYNDEIDDVSNYFDKSDYKDFGSDTKHIYKKLLKPKKSVLFKFHSKPKHKKLKFKLNKKHLHNKDWFNDYPFNF